jgi:hypothetical protein
MSVSDQLCAAVCDWCEQIKKAPAGHQLSFSLSVLHLTRARFQELLPLLRPLTMDGEAEVDASLEDAGTRIAVLVKRMRPTVYRITPTGTASDWSAGLFLPRGGRK